MHTVNAFIIHTHTHLDSGIYPPKNRLGHIVKCLSQKDFAPPLWRNGGTLEKFGEMGGKYIHSFTISLTQVPPTHTKGQYETAPNNHDTHFENPCSTFRLFNPVFLNLSFAYFIFSLSFFLSLLLSFFHSHAFSFLSGSLNVC